MPRTQGWGTVGKGPPACLPEALGDTPHVFRRHRSNHENVRTQGQRVTVLFVPPVGETDCGSGPSGLQQALSSGALQAPPRAPPPGASGRKRKKESRHFLGVMPSSKGTRGAGLPYA